MEIMYCFNRLPIHIALLFQSDDDPVTATCMIGAFLPYPVPWRLASAYFTCQELLVLVGR